MPPPGWKNDPHWRVYHDVQCQKKLSSQELHRRWRELETQRQALNAAADVILDNVTRDMKLKTKH